MDTTGRATPRVLANTALHILGTAIGGGKSTVMAAIGSYIP